MLPFCSVVQNHWAILEESLITLGRRQSKMLILSTNVDKNLKKSSFRLPFVAQLRQMEIEKSVSSDF